MTECEECGGSGECGWCNGTGIVSGDTCSDCEGSGNCNVCQGKGEVEEPAAGTYRL